MAPVAVSVTVKWLCSWCDRVVPEKSRIVRQITPRQPTDHFNVFLYHFGLIPPDASAHRRERVSVSSHSIASQVSGVCQACVRFTVLEIVAPVTVSVTVKWLCSWCDRVVAEKSRRARQITPRQPTDHFNVFFSDFRVTTVTPPQFHESPTFYSPLKKKEKPTVVIFRRGLPATFFGCWGLQNNRQCMQRAIEVLFSTAHTFPTRGCSHFTTVPVTRPASAPLSDNTNFHLYLEPIFCFRFRRKNFRV